MSSINSFETINPALIDVFFQEHTGYPDELRVQDTRDVLRDVCGAATRDFPQSMWIEPRDWPDRARQNDQCNGWAMNYIDRYTNQNPTHECTCHSLRANFEAAWNRQRAIAAGPPEAGVRKPLSERSSSVWVSPLSVYAEANPRQWGGANVQQVLEIAVRRGMLPEPIQPKPYKFAHTLHGTTGSGGINQAKGDWVSVSRFAAGWQATAKHFRPLEVIFPDSYEQAICLLLNGIAVSVGRNGHAVPWASWNATSRVCAYPDSYDVTRYDSERTARSAWQGSFAIVSTTIPDDWDNPAPV
ncbi:MAG: hypothetical protein IPJ01_12175 [Micavibrio sp.]|nr:hypothetical protein [Micavibrio sp.]